MKLLIPFFFCLLSCHGILFAQNDSGHNYRQLIRDADKDFQAGQYGQAYNKYLAARGFKGANMVYIAGRMDACQKGIETQQRAAEDVLKRAIKAEKEARDQRDSMALVAFRVQIQRDSALKAAKYETDSLKNILDAQQKAIQTANAEKMATLLLDAEHALSKLEYDSAFSACRNIALIKGVDQAPVQPLLHEITFFYTENGQFLQAGEVFVLAQRPPPPANRKDLSDALEAWNKSAFDSLQRLYYPELVSVGGGYFLMGCIPGRDGICELDETPQHYAAVRNFRMGRTELTNRQYYLFAAQRDPQMLPLGPNVWADSPVHSVSWFDALEYLNWASKQQGLTPVYDIRIETIQTKKRSRQDTTILFDQQADGFRLPTETEWEYAARGGQYLDPFRYAGSDTLDQVAWNKANSQAVQPVARLLPNRLGLYDMSGNLAEWCWDFYSESYPSESRVDYPGPKFTKKSGQERVIRGSDRNGNNLRTAFRNKAPMNTRADWLGFRVAANQTPGTTIKRTAVP